MNNITYVKTPTFIVNANGRLSESLRPDDSKGLRQLVVETRTFESLKAALAWINKEGQKKSTNLFLYEIRPAAQGTYTVRCAIDAVKPVRKATPKANAKPKASNNANNNAKTPARTPNRNSNNSASNNNTAVKNNSNNRSANNRTSTNNRTTANSKSTNSRTKGTKSKV